MESIIPPNVPQKQCCRCKEFLPATIEYFGKYKKSKDGFRFACKKCRNAHEIELRQARLEERRAYEIAYREANRESIRENNRRYERKLPKGHRNGYQRNWQRKHSPERELREKIRRVNDPVYANKRREACRHYQITYRERFRESGRRSRLKHAEKYRQYRRTPAYRAVAAAISHRRRAKINNAQGDHTPEQIQALLVRQKHTCYYCRRKLQKNKGKYFYHVDHVMPLSRGGSNDIDNLVIACPACNLKKSNKLLHEWPEGGRLL